MLGNVSASQTKNSVQALLDDYCQNNEVKVHSTKGSFPIEKATKLGNSAFRGGGGVVKKSKKSQVSVGNSSKLGGGSSEIKKVPSSRGYQRLKKNDSFPSYEDPKT